MDTFLLFEKVFNLDQYGFGFLWNLFANIE